MIAAGLALSPLVPRTYKSTSTILVQGQNVPSVYREVFERQHQAHDAAWKQIKLEVMSGNGFPQIIEKFNLYPKLRKQARHDSCDCCDAQGHLGRGSSGCGRWKRRSSGLHHLLHRRTPQEARDVTREITDLFISESVKGGTSAGVREHTLF